MTIHDDLCKRIHARLALWVKDSYSLYDMGDIPYDDAVKDIISALSSNLMMAFIAHGLSEGEAIRLLVNVVREAYQEHNHG